MPRKDDYLAAPIEERIMADAVAEAQGLPPQPQLSETHELVGGFWRPKVPPSTPTAPAIDPGTSLEDASTLKFALLCWDALSRVSRLALADETPLDLYSELKGERRAYRRVLAYLGFGPDERPSLENRRTPTAPR